MIKFLFLLALLPASLGTQAKPKIVFKITCPQDKELRHRITTTKPDDNLSAKCQKSSRTQEEAQTTQPGPLDPSLDWDLRGLQGEFYRLQLRSPYR